MPHPRQIALVHGLFKAVSSYFTFNLNSFHVLINKIKKEMHLSSYRFNKMNRPLSLVFFPQLIKQVGLCTCALKNQSELF